MRHPTTATPAGPVLNTPLRWEWRTFSPSPLLAKVERFVHGAAGVVGDETYVLSRRSVHNVKIRLGRLEVKRLQATAYDGLELWRPTMAEPFPVDANALEMACDALGISPPEPAAIPWSAAVFLAQFVVRVPVLRAVSLTKRRTPLLLGECPGEHVALTIAGQRWESIAFEDALPERVVGAVTTLSFAVRDNTSYPAALKRIAGMPAADAAPTLQETI